MLPRETGLHRRGTIEVSSAGDVLVLSGEVDQTVVAVFVEERRRAGTWRHGLVGLDVVDVRSATFLDSGAAELVWSVATDRNHDRERLTIRGASPLFAQVLDVVGAAALVRLVD